jgi:signal transduction histidine kinase
MLNSSKRLLLEAEAQLDHNRLLSLINGLSDGFLAIDETGVIELSNSVALDILDTNALKNKNIVDAMPIIDVYGETVNLFGLIQASGLGYISRDYRLRYKDGSIINLYVNASPVKAAFGSTNKDGYVVLFRNITSEKSAEDERDEFISVASHELRNPVAIAEGSISNARLLVERAQVPGNIEQVLKSAHEQVVFLGSLINDLALISRADRERFIQQAKEFDINDVIKSLQTDFTSQAQKKGLQINAEVGSSLKIKGSRLYTKEVLQNFITNAIKYTQKGSITIKAAADSQGVGISVADSGIGIDADEQRKLFSKFFRSEDSRVRQISGTGLGLYVSAKLARLMGGSISMKSQLNKGSEFTLHLPLVIGGSKEVA